MLTEQNKLFIEKYIELKCKNQTQAAINAGYSKKSAASQATEMLKKPEIQAYLEERKTALLREIQEKIVFTALEAVDVVYQIMTDPEAKNSERLSAARDILDRAGITNELLAKTTADKDESNTGVIALNSVDLEAYEAEKERMLKELTEGAKNGE